MTTENLPESNDMEDMQEKIKEALTKLADMAFHLSKVVECIMLIYGLIKMETIKPVNWEYIMDDFKNSQKFLEDLLKSSESKQNIN